MDGIAARFSREAAPSDRFSNCRDYSGPERTIRSVEQLTARRSGAQSYVAQTGPSLPRAALLGVTSCTLTGCSFMEAPSFELFGAYFPAWMLCALIGIVGAASVRVVLTTPAVDDVIPLQLAVCSAVGVIAGVLAWMVLFR
jgi:hypothetical protein